MDRLYAYRADTYQLRPGLRVKDKETATDFVNQRGFVFFWPVKGLTLPSLWEAVAGDRPVPNEHDDPGHVTWSWKDSALGERRWYYAKVLRKRATLISLAMAPYFYALTENYGAPEEDYRLQYEAGRMTYEAKTVYETILREGPIDTVALRRATRLTSRESNSPFNRALTNLQGDFKILPVGVAEAGAWRYAFVYDLVPRHLPDLPEQARFIGEKQARRELAAAYFRSVGAVPVAEVVKLFQWRRPEVEAAVDALVEAGILRRALRVEGQRVEWAGLTELVLSG